MEVGELGQGRGRQEQGRGRQGRGRGKRVVVDDRKEVGDCRMAVYMLYLAFRSSKSLQLYYTN